MWVRQSLRQCTFNLTISIPCVRMGHVALKRWVDPELNPHPATFHSGTPVLGGAAVQQ